MNVGPGWYPDPTGLWEFRYWDGTVWTDQVVTGGYQSTDAHPPTDQPPARPDTVLWSMSGVFEREPVRVDLHWHLVAFVPTRRVHETRYWPLGFLRSLTFDSLAADGSGDLRFGVGGPGYVGPGVVLVRQVTAAAQARAIVLRQRALIAGIPAAAS